MRKSLTFISCILALLLMANVPVLAHETSAPLPRGEFASLLVKAAELEGEGEPADILMEHQIMKGVPGKDADLVRPITQVEAAVLISRTLGIPDDVSTISDGEALLPADHWASGVYAWLDRLGIVSGDPLAILGADEAAEMVQTTFETSAEAAALLEKIQEQSSLEKITTLKATTSGTIRLIPRAGAPGAEEIPALTASSETIQEMVLPSTIHQLTTTTLTLPEVGVQTITMESYMVGGQMYQQLPNSETGEPEWYKYPEDMINLDLEAILEAAEQSTQPIPPGLEKSLFYKVLGTTELNGKPVYELAFYGKLDDLNVLLEAFSDTFGEGLLPEETFEQASEMITGFSFWGLSYVDVENYQTEQSDFGTYVMFSPEFEDEQIPIEAIEMFMKTGDYVYNSPFEIEIPEEVLAAPELTLP